MTRPNDSHNHPWIDVFQSQGFIQCWGEQHKLLSLSTCRDLRRHILQEWRESLPTNSQQPKDVDDEDDNGTTNESHTTDEYADNSRFSLIRQRKHRWDFKLTDTPLVRRALREILSTQHSGTDIHNPKEAENPEILEEQTFVFLQDILTPLLDVNVDDYEREQEYDQEDDDDERSQEEQTSRIPASSSNDNTHQQTAAAAAATQPHQVILVELGALISEPGAPAQEWHPDSVHMGAANKADTDDDDDSRVTCGCCFVTLQPTPATFGPTQLLPQTHTRDFHACALQNFPPKGILPYNDLGGLTDRQQPGYRWPGEACVMDVRCYHRGGANVGLLLKNDDDDHDHDDKTKDNNSDKKKDDRDDNTKQTTLAANQNKADDDDDDDDNESWPEPERRVVFYFSFRSEASEPPGGYLYTIQNHLKDIPLQSFVDDAGAAQ